MHGDCRDWQLAKINYPKLSSDILHTVNARRYSVGFLPHDRIFLPYATCLG